MFSSVIGSRTWYEGCGDWFGDRSLSEGWGGRVILWDGKMCSPLLVLDFLAQWKSDLIFAGIVIWLVDKKSLGW